MYSSMEDGVEKARLETRRIAKEVNVVLWWLCEPEIGME